MEEVQESDSLNTERSSKCEQPDAENQDAVVTNKSLQHMFKCMLEKMSDNNQNSGNNTFIQRVSAR
jgi:hypothetical protein